LRDKNATGIYACRTLRLCHIKQEMTNQLGQCLFMWQSCSMRHE